MSAQPEYDESRVVNGVIEVTAVENDHALDAAARRLLGISGAEFRRRWDAGEYANIDPDEDRAAWDVAFYIAGGWNRS